MIRSCPRNHPAQITPSKPSFILFKPLMVIACLTIAFELLPIDFQHYIAPGLVSFEDVYFAGLEPETRTVTARELVEGTNAGDECPDYTQSLPEPSL